MEFLEGPNHSVIRNRPKKTLDFIPNPPPLDFSLSNKLLEDLAQIPTQDLAKFIQKNCGRVVRLADGFNLFLGESADQKPLEWKSLDPKYPWPLSQAIVGCNTGRVIIDYEVAWWILADKFADLLEKRE
ncbi:hypothetical protein BC938DRAFT_480952 [Jimgerdemannia flammicorona]|uniref:Uncharacterized protein n=1 Tax=Jimgerdemannia flammicorona TaxID=994334 RepID=A0A433QHB3_9FUNG|nr:hypothetical protein BC938DRAFT_480952 [Jimgerdemannia flammicorona]